MEDTGSIVALPVPSIVILITRQKFSYKKCCTNGSDVHYANMSVQYTAIFHGCKNDNFQMKFFDIFLIFAQNIDCGYTLEPPR